MDIFTKTEEYETIIKWRDNIVKFLIGALVLAVFSGALFDGRPIIVAAMLMIVAAFAFQFTKVVEKMDLFKHNPDALANKVINHMPRLIFLSACGLALLG